MLNKMISIIAEELSIRPEKIRETSMIKEDLDVDRADLLSIVTDLEDEFDIIIDYNKLDEFRTIMDLENYVASKI